MPIRTLPKKSDWTGDFVGRLTSQYQSLGLAPPEVVDAVAGPQQRPELLLFFGERPWEADAAFQAELESYASKARYLLPVVESSPQAVTHLPKEIQTFNAFQRLPHGKNWPDALVDEVLTLAWQRRAKRRIFISYRRVDAEGVAQQLYERYTERSFEVFLDDVTIPRGLGFQAELSHWLEDADAVLLLISPQIASSQWVREEIGLALTRRVGLLGIVWPTPLFPGGVLPAAAEQVPSDRQLKLTVGQLGALEPTRQALDAACLGEVDHLLFTGRSQAIASRLRDLISIARTQLARDYDITSVSPDGDLELQHKLDKTAWLARVVPFRPGIAELWRWWQELSKGGISGVVIIYPELDALDEQSVALREVCRVWGASITPALRLLVAKV